MATSYQDIYSRFLPKITNYDFVTLTDQEIEQHLEIFLKSSIVKFKFCDKLSDRDETLFQFNKDLTEEEQEILAVLMCVEYLSPKLLTDDLLQQRLSTKDYYVTSQANQIKEIRELSDKYQKDAANLMIAYTFKNNKLDLFK